MAVNKSKGMYKGTKKKENNENARGERAITVICRFLNVFEANEFFFLHFFPGHFFCNFVAIPSIPPAAQLT